MQITETNEFRNLLAFLILMGNKEILTKSPDYILEKFERYLQLSTPLFNTNDTWQFGLDSNNASYFQGYLRIWGIPLPDLDLGASA